MRKKLKVLAVLSAMFMTLTGCAKGVEKEYTMNVKSEVISDRIKEDENETVNVLHCKRKLSLFDYYIVVPETEEGFELPETLTAKATDTKTKYIIIKDSKSETVTDHGYIFVKWGK